ncbi:MAG: hypothetical protein IH819_10150 [Bacteroidetes bacterium]|nr:hypothetical protein [Bacteroidota bacterium]
MESKKIELDIVITSEGKGKESIYSISSIQIPNVVTQGKSIEEAKASLISSFTLSEEQSIAILEMRLQRLTSLEQEKVKNEHKDLLKLIEDLKSILQSPQKTNGL